MKIISQKTILTLITIFFIVNSVFAQKKTEILTNESIISLCASGLSNTVIISKIKKSKTDFNTETADLLKLKELKVPDEVMNAMIEASDQSSADMGSQSNQNDIKKSGIYLVSDLDKTETALELSHTSPGKIVWSMITKLDGTTAKIRTFDKKPVFYFYFDKISNNNPSEFFNASSSPTQFLFIKLTTSTNTRDIKFVVKSSQFLIDNKNKIPFDYEKVSDFIYKVTPKSSLSSGEYCFLPIIESRVDIVSIQGSKVFDFSVNNISYKKIVDGKQNKYESYGLPNKIIQDSINTFLGYVNFSNNLIEYSTTIIYNKNSILTKQTEGGNKNNNSKISDFKYVRSLNTTTGQTLFFKDIFEQKFVNDLKDMIYKQAEKDGCTVKLKKLDLYNQPISISDEGVYFNFGCNCGKPECEKIEKPIIIPITKIDQFMIEDGLIENLISKEKEKK